MGQKAITSRKLTDTLTMSELKNGFWLYDSTQSMNLSMKAKTEEAAFIEALEYYQRSCKDMSKRLKRLTNAVDIFVDTVTEDEDFY